MRIPKQRNKQGQFAKQRLLTRERLFIHIPIGILGSIFMRFLPLQGAVFTASFLFYEGLQDWRKRDSSYKDVIGQVIGLGIGTGAQVAWMLWTSYVSTL